MNRNRLKEKLQKILVRVVFFIILLMAGGSVQFAQITKNDELPAPIFDVAIKPLPTAECSDYNLPLKGGEFFRLAAEQQGVDLWLQFFDTDNKPLNGFDIDSPNNTVGEEFFVYHASVAGNYRLQICHDNRYDGNYLLSKNPLPENESNSDFIESVRQAETFFNTGENTKISREERVSGYKKAIEIYQSLAGKDDSNWIKYRLGLIYYREGGILVELEDQPSAAADFERSVSLAGQIGDSNLESWSRNDLGWTYYRLGKYEEAAMNLKRAVELLEAIQNCGAAERKNCFARQFAYAESRYSLVLSLRGEPEKALEYTQQTLDFFLEKPDYKLDKKDPRYDWDKNLPSIKTAEPSILNNAGLVYAAQGRRQEAIGFLEKAYSRFESNPESKNIDKIHTLNILGNIYESLAQPGKAGEYFEKALQLSAALKPAEQALETAIINTGKGRLSMRSEPDTALEIFEQALIQFTKIGKADYQAIVLNFIGQTYHSKKEYQKALIYYLKARNLRDKENIANSLDYGQLLNNIGAAYFESGNKMFALNYYQEALQFHLTNGLRTSKAETYHNLMIYYKNEGQNSVAIFYGKLAINEYQSLRYDIRDLNSGLRENYLLSIEDTYRTLALLLIKEKRFDEFERVTYLLKEEEYSQFAEKGRPAVSVGERIGWLPIERQLFDEYAKANSDLELINREMKILENKKPLLNIEEKKYRQLKTESDRLKRKISAKPQISFENKTKISQIDPEIETKFLKSIVNRAGGAAVGIYVTLLPPNELGICLAAKGKDLVCAIDTGSNIQTSAEDLVLNFKTKLSEIATKPIDPKYLKKQIDFAQSTGMDYYDRVIKPVEKELSEARVKGADTIYWSLDGDFRYLPVAAIYNKQKNKYLVEEFANVIMRDFGAKTRPVFNSDKKVLGLGTTNGFDDVGQGRTPFKLDPLIQNMDEVCHVIKSEFCSEFKQENNPNLFGGEIYYNEKFKAACLTNSRDLLKSDDFFSMLVSSHFLVGKSASDSYLYIGNDLLPLSEINRDADFSQFEIVFFSACETARSTKDSNGVEIEGLGFLAQSKGAKAVISTVYGIPAGGSSLLVATFYELKKQNPTMSNAKLLQAAQLRLLYSSFADNSLKQRPEPVINFSPRVDSTKLEMAMGYYRHPYYWSGFILADSEE